MKSSSFIRDLLVKILLIVIFIFLLMCLFPMPNLNPFYSQIFNDNIQTMKDAAEDYYTTERMPSEVGKSTKMTLKDMIDQKLIIPFVDKDGNECNTSKSYVKVTKLENEYELKVSLTCGKESNYIIEKIGCYNFCPTGNCTLAEVKDSEVNSEPVKSVVDENGNINVVVPTGKYITEYEFIKRLSSESWSLGDYRDTKLTETADIKLVDTRTQYTGQKKVGANTTLYEQVAYDYKDNWTYDNTWVSDVKTGTDIKKTDERTLYTGQKKIENVSTEKEYVLYDTKDNWTYDSDWTTEVKTTSDTLKLWQERTLYTGQKKIEANTTEYQHVKYGYKDNWTYDSDWTTEVKTTSDTLKLWQERTLYTGYKAVKTTTTKYQHVKYEITENITETGYSTTKRDETNDVILAGIRYTVTKDIDTTTTTCDDYVVDSEWYTSVPANTSTRTYSSTPVNTKSEYGNWTVIYDSYKLTSLRSTYEGNRWYEFLYYNDEICTSACNGKSTVRYYYYRVHEGTLVNYYQYKYCTPKSVTTKTTDTKVVTDLAAYTSQGYKLVKTEYNYKIRTYTKTLVDTKWTTSITPEEGYEYTGKTSTTTTISYEPLNKWVTSKDALGEYIYNLKTITQYKYAYNNKTKYIVDTKWTTSITPEEGYEYTGKTSTTTSIKYEQLNKWVTSKDALGEYTYNINTVKQYKYAYNNKTKYIKDTKWFSTTDTIPSGYVATGKTNTIYSIKYEQLNKWVTSKDALGEYTYNIKTVKQYKYAYNNKTKYIKDTIWTTENIAKDGYTLTGNTKVTTKTTYVDLGNWVNSKSELGEYTENIQTRTQYRYKYRKVTTSTETKWATSNPRNGFEPTGNSRKTYVSTSTNQK